MFLAKRDKRPNFNQKGVHYFMDNDLKRRLVYGMLSLVLGMLATRLALYLTNKLLGELEEEMF